MRPFHLLLVSTGLTGVVVLGALVVTEPSGAPDAAPSTAQANGPVTAPDRAAASAARVLRTWDRARAAAWAAG
ncbi:MAG TPA: hypothetical protein VGE38_03630, partial [Nocardioides sp.]|uniref:hypothetical protein n=1 Tax=Nocardioides sp. TaxID=35761 RepID=UPI002EDA8611